MKEMPQEKLKILADAARYDVSCSSGGGKRKNTDKGLGNAEGLGICHSYTEDGRCVSLLQILLTNFCIYDSAYCATRKSNELRDYTKQAVCRRILFGEGFVRKSLVKQALELFQKAS